MRKVKCVRAFIAIDSLCNRRRPQWAASCENPARFERMRPTLEPRDRRRVLGLGHPNRKHPSEPEGQKIKREENDEAHVITKRALDNESDEISCEVTRDHEGDVVNDQ